MNWITISRKNSKCDAYIHIPKYIFVVQIFYFLFDTTLYKRAIVAYSDYMYIKLQVFKR